MIYYIADMHFGHTNVLRFDNRPFSDTAQMDDTLIQNWNGRVTSDDTVYVLGDAFWKNEENSIQIMERLRGHKHLIQGNHDRVKGKLRFYWESITQYAEVNDENRLVILSHYNYVEAVNEKDCVACGQCENSCPDFVIHVEKDA